MKETFNHKAASSFYLWFDNYLLSKGEAFINRIDNFYPSSDNSLPGFSVYSSPYKQIVWDESISGATIPSGVYHNGDFIPKGVSGLKIDHLNGRILLSSGIGVDSFSGVFSQKEFNTYFANESDLPLVLEGIMGNNPNLDSPATGIPSSIYSAPCCITSISASKNTPFSFGGQDITDFSARVLVVSKDLWQMDGLLSIFRDSNNTTIPLVPSSGLPLDFYGDLKYNYNYSNIEQLFCSPNLFIEKVLGSKTSEKINNNQTYFVSSLEFQLQAFRYPRQEV